MGERDELFRLAAAIDEITAFAGDEDVSVEDTVDDFAVESAGEPEGFGAAEGG